MVERMNDDEIAEDLKAVAGWEQQGNWLSKQFEFEDFQEALAFVNQVAEIAEALNHHPDISLQNYNQVILNTTTHEVGGITENDVALINRIETEVLKG